MSGTYYCHECEARRSVELTPIATCSMCGCCYIEEIPTVIEEDITTDEEDFNRELDFFFIHEGQEDDDEELLEERCLYEQLSSIYNHPIARNFDSEHELQVEGEEQRRIDELLSNITDNHEHEAEQEQEEERITNSIDNDNDNDNDIVAYDVLFEQRTSGSGNNNRANTIGETTIPEGSTSIFQLPFARIGRLLDTMYNFGSDEESEGGDELNSYNRRSFLDNLADVLSDYNQDIETTTIPAANSPPIEDILSSLKKKVLLANDPDVEDECIICQDAFGTTIEIFHLPCHHKFHGNCISRWLNIKTSCPICRQSAYNDSVSQSDQDEGEEAVLGTAVSNILSNTLQNNNHYTENASATTEEMVRDFVGDQDLIDRRDRLQRLRQELVSRRNHWLSSSPTNYQLNVPPPTSSNSYTGEFYDDIMSHSLMDEMDWAITASSMEEVD